MLIECGGGDQLADIGLLKPLSQTGSERFLSLLLRDNGTLKHLGCTAKRGEQTGSESRES